MEATVRTIYSSHIATCKYLKKSMFPILTNTTVNEKFHVNDDISPPVESLDDPTYTSLKYIAIGRKGVTYEVESGGEILPTPIPHLARDANLYQYIPFVARPLNNDLTSIEREKYRMRVVQTLVVSGSPVDYALYYLKVLDVGSISVNMELRTVNGITITTEPFIPQPSDLNPEPVVIPNVDINNPDGKYLVSSAKITLTLTPTEIQDIITACTLLFGDPRKSVISELAVCTGIDTPMYTNPLDPSVQYTEVRYCQVSTFLSQYYALVNAVSDINITLDVGSVEPLLV